MLDRIKPLFAATYGCRDPELGAPDRHVRVSATVFGDKSEYVLAKDPVKSGIGSLNENDLLI